MGLLIRPASLQESATVHLPSFTGFSAFKALATSNLLAHSAEQMGTATLMIVAVATLGAGPGSTGAIQALATLPFLLLAIPIGALTDRSSPRAVMVTGELIRLLALVTFAMLLDAGQLTLMLLAILGLIGSTGTVAFTIGAPSVVAAMVARGGLIRANTSIELTRSLAIAAGPALAGAVIGWTGAGLALGIAIGCSMFALMLLIALPAHGHAKRTGSPLEDVVAGTRWTLHHPLLRPIIVTAVVFNTAWFCLQGVFVAYAMGPLGFSPAQVGWTLASYGVGMIAGAAMSRFVFQRLSVGAAICVGPIAGFTAMAIMALSLATAREIAPAMAYFLLGAGPIIWTITTTTLRQSVTPHHMLGRVSAVIVTATAGARPVGAAIGALVATWFGVEWVLLLCLFGMSAQVIVIATSAAARLHDYPDEVDTVPAASHVAGVRS